MTDEQIKEILDMANKATITSAYDKLFSAVQAAIDKKEEKDNKTEKDEAILEGLSTFLDEIENSFGDLMSAYED